MIKLILLISKACIFSLTIIYNYNISWKIVHAESLNYTFNDQRRINQLYQITHAHSECLMQIQQQLTDNQNNINALRGHIQDIQHHISIINEEQKKSIKKLDEILHIYQNKYIIDNNHQSLKTSELKKNITIKNNTQENDHDYVYKQAVSLVLEKRQYNQAIQAFQNFIEDYPNSEYQSNAHYWLGQLYYNENNKDKASYYFALVTKHYPKSLKAPDALFKLGVIMQETHQKDQAKIIYRQISKLYPNSNAAKQAQKHLSQL